MVRTASAAAALVFAASLGSAALAQEPQAAKAPAPAAVPTAPAAAVPVPIATPPAPSLNQAMQAQALADAPPSPPPPPAPLAAPSVAVAAGGLAPAAKAAPKLAFAAPPASVAASTAPLTVAKVEAPVAAPVVIAVAAPVPAGSVEPAPVLVKVSAPAPVAIPAVVMVVPKTPAPSALVARRVTDAAGAFDAWTEKAGRIDGKFADAAGVSAALADTSAFQAQQLEEGAVAFGALAALQDPVFVQSAHELATLGGDHAAAAAVLLKEPSQVMTLPGADGAAAFAAQALSAKAQAVVAAGKSVRQAAYSMQVDSWAKTAVPSPEKRLADAKVRSSAAIALDGPASELLMRRLVELRTSRQSVSLQGRTAPTPLVTRSLALAAMIVLGEADEAHAAALTPILVESKSGDCLKMAKLNLFQCLSVAGPHYEDAFCIGQHGLGEAGQCLAAATGAVSPAPVAAPVLIAAAGPAPSAGVSVPIALLAEGGPERSAAFAPPAPAPQPQPEPPLSAAPIQLAQAAPVLPETQPRWAREAAPPQAPAYAEPTQPRYDRGLAYRWDRQQRATDYAAPGYAPPAYGYADPRQGYGQYAQPVRRLAEPQGYGYDPRDGDDDDGAAPIDPRGQAPQRGAWGYR